MKGVFFTTFSRTTFDRIEREPQEERTGGQRSIQSVDRAFDLLEVLAASRGELPLKEISQRVGLSKSTCHGLLATMERRGYVGQTASGAYTLGLRLTELGVQAVNRLDLRREAKEALRRLSTELQETVHLVTLQGTDVVYIDKIESQHSIRMVTQIGSRFPAWCTGVGKAVLANLPQIRLEKLLLGVELQPRTTHTITDKERFREHLAQVRRQGFAIDDEEFDIGLRCLAAPIFDHTHACVGALSVSGPSVRMGPNRLALMISAVKQAAAEVSRRMGYIAP